MKKINLPDVGPMSTKFRFMLRRWLCVGAVAVTTLVSGVTLHALGAWAGYAMGKQYPFDSELTRTAVNTATGATETLTLLVPSIFLVWLNEAGLWLGLPLILAGGFTAVASVVGSVYVFLEDADGQKHYD